MLEVQEMFRKFFKHFMSSYYSGSKCWKRKRCFVQATKSPDQRRPSFWASWLAPEVCGSTISQCILTFSNKIILKG